MEQQQFTGSFKERGACNALLSLSSEVSRAGVKAASAGNHALALSYHGANLGIVCHRRLNRHPSLQTRRPQAVDHKTLLSLHAPPPCRLLSPRPLSAPPRQPVTVVMPTVAPLAKVDKCRALGANVIVHGAHIGEAKEWAMSSPEFEGMHYINGYDDPEIIAGAGTLAIEALEKVADLDAIIVPVGGAGLIAGVALAVKTLNPAIRVIGVEPKRCASFAAALEAGRPVPVDVAPTLADGLAVPCVGPHAFAVARQFVDEMVQVDESEVALAVLRLVELEKLVVEGGGAAGLAAILPGGPLDRPDLKGKKVLVPLCGGNIDTTVLGRVIERGLAADGRLVRLVASVSDRPGGIAELTRRIYEQGASVKDIFHERAWLFSSVDQVRVKVVLETLGKAHNERILAALRDAVTEVYIESDSMYTRF